MTPAADSLDARHAGVGVAIFNAVGAAVGGFLGPFIVGAFVQRMGTFVSSMVAMGAFLCWAGVMMVALWVYTRWALRHGKKLPVGSHKPNGTSISAAAKDTHVCNDDTAPVADVELAAAQANWPNARAQSTFKV